MSAKISFVVPSVANPVIGPVTVLARILESRYEVEIVGSDAGQGVCPMYCAGYPYKAIQTPRIYRLPDYLWEIGKISRAVTGDLVIAVKAFAETVPVAWWHKITKGRKAAVYLDEWDGSLIRMMSTSQRRRQILRNLHHPGDDIYCPLMERLMAGFDAVLSTTTFLQRRFGGHIVHMGVDTDFFAPAAPDRVRELRADLGLGDAKHIVFGGVVRPHKGIELLLDALVRIGNPAYRLLVVGPINEHVKALQAHKPYRPHLVTVGAKPKEEMPQYLSLGNLTVLPLNDNLLAHSQMPCKVFEAMAMGLPVIGSAVSDLPQVLEGCGRVVPANDTEALAEAIEEILSNQSLAEQMGEQARLKCINEYSAQATRVTLNNIVENLLVGGH
jgi:glycosyltransferase involved in cell wall biosynthesis